MTRLAAMSVLVAATPHALYVFDLSSAQARARASEFAAAIAQRDPRVTGYSVTHVGTYDRYVCPRALIHLPLAVRRPMGAGRAAVAPAEVGRPLTDAKWQRILPLLPPQRPPFGRPRHGHRKVLNGILSVLRSGASWREMPQEYGKWETAYRRYRRWQDEGRLQRILEALDLPAPRPPP